jgi:hypothetical protein
MVRTLAGAMALTALALSAQSGGVIEGRVTNSVTGEAVAGVEVRFLDRQSYVYKTATDSTGSYRLTGLKDNDYFGGFTKDGFSELRAEGRGNHVAGDVPVRVNVEIQPLGVLRGRVVDEDGTAAPGVRVECSCTRDDAITDENGAFAFQDLRPGSYTLVAKPKANIREQDGVRLGTVAIYYPSVTEMEQAAWIPVRAGENVAGIEIRLKSVPVRHVSGMVMNEAGKPVAHATVKLMGHTGRARHPMMYSPGFFYTIGPDPVPELARVESREDGTFEFAAVQPGDWRLSAEAGVEDDMPLGDVASVLVSEKDVEDVRLRLVAPFAVEVNVDWGGAKPPSGGYGGVSVSLTPLEAQPRLIVDPAKNVGRINGILPGRYRVTPQGTRLDVYPSAVMWGGRDVKGQVVELTAGAAPLQVIYKPGLGKVRGEVERGEGAMVMLVPRDAGEVSTILTARCGAGGVFEIGRVVPGDYYAVAFDHGEGQGVQWDALLSTILPLASSVRVEEGSTVSLDLRPNRWPW